MGGVTEVLQEVAQGDRSRVDLLFSVVYQDLRRMAASLLRRERHSQTLEPTALVNEAYLKLVDQRQANWKTRSHFLAVSAEVMRRILVDRARHRARSKHGGDMLRITLTDLNARTLSVSRELDVLVVDEILTRLEKIDPRQAKIVELRFYGGLTLDEVAEALGISRRTVAYEWRIVRASIRAELSTFSAKSS
jgi:RNA polymerase sigma factor (TIGR02999 family)